MAMETHLKEWMEYYGVTSDMIAFKSGMSAKVIDKYVNGETTPSLAAIKTISETIGVSIDNLVGITPSEMIDNMELQESMHIAETTSHKLAVRVQNYCKANGIECRVIAIIGDYENFIIQYSGNVIDVKELVKISRKLKYRDEREKNIYDEEVRYKDMEITKL